MLSEVMGHSDYGRFFILNVYLFIESGWWKMHQSEDSSSGREWSVFLSLVEITVEITLF